jgi:hypothetical protein
MRGTHGIFVSGNDVYVAGWVYRQGKSVATLWKNGEATSLAPHTTWSYAYDMVVVDGDVYVAGVEEVDSKQVARCWKNGNPMPVTSGDKPAVALGLFVQ